MYLSISSFVCRDTDLGSGSAFIHEVRTVLNRSRLQSFVLGKKRQVREAFLPIEEIGGLSVKAINGWSDRDGKSKNFQFSTLTKSPNVVMSMKDVFLGLWVNEEYDLCGVDVEYCWLPVARQKSVREHLSFCFVRRLVLGYCKQL